ncbi:hypothetical protein KDA23_06200 [Candidatus Saccharibacteria bacterium]|nr:hypothetical protein [Candidatus Saccharibacteria bacterium]
MRKPLGDLPSTQPPHTTGDLFDLLDTAWRAIVPVVVLTYFGSALDSKMESAPWFMLLGASLSLLLAIFLMRQKDQS